MSSTAAGSETPGEAWVNGLRTDLTRRETCPCGVEVDKPAQTWVFRVVLYGIFPLLSIGLYLLALLAGRKLMAEVSMVAGLLVLLIPLISLLVTMLVQALARHRGGCLLRRSLRWWVTWPGATLAAIGGR